METSKPQIIFRSTCPELNALPEEYVIRVDKTPENRVFFEHTKTKETTYIHPTLGQLPALWILKLHREQGQSPTTRYYHTTKMITTNQDPRYLPEFLESRILKVPSEVKTASRVRKNVSGISMDQLIRTPIGKTSIRKNYEILHAIDNGDGTIGGMNGGIFVVRPKGGRAQLCVEKRFKAKDMSIAWKEIQMLHKLRHGSLTFYMASFIIDTEDLKTASVYVEFCDRGSLEGLISAYSKIRSTSSPKPEVPEQFIWHAFAGLCDGLAYLLGGRTFMEDESRTKFAPVPNWKSILHRDIKPDNVLLRSRSTLGVKRYFYCVLSDFGLACEDDDNEQYQSVRCKLGTKHFWAPELCWDPYPSVREQYPKGDPRRLEQIELFPPPNKHTPRSDIWALGACIYNLADCDSIKLNQRPLRGAYAHLTMDRKPPELKVYDFLDARISRKNPLKIGNSYSKQLREAVLYATRWKPEDRPDAIKLIKRIRELMEKAGVLEGGSRSKFVELPSWATKVHDYHSRLPIVRED